MLAYWLFGVVCRFVDIDGGETLFDVVQEEGEGGLRHSTVRVVGVWYLTFSWSLYQSQSIASFGGLAAILSLSRISTQPEIDLSDHYTLYIRCKRVQVAFSHWVCMPQS